MKPLHSKILELLPETIAEPVIEPETLLVSYTDSKTAKKVTLKLGRLLAKKTSLSLLEVKKLVEFQRRNLKRYLIMKLTQEADEIVSFYEYMVAPSGGSGSCMYRKSCVRVYSYDPNLYLATFYDGDEADEYSYVGRTLVRTDTMEYIRTYATEQHYHDNILLTLDKAGYSEGSLIGIKLAREQTDEGFLMPYLDIGGQYVSDCGSYFEVVDYPTSYKANTTNGILLAGCSCGHCGSFVDEDETFWTDQEGGICGSCWEEYYTTFEEEAYLVSDCTLVYGGDYNGQLVPNDLLSNFDYYLPEDDLDYCHISLLENCSNGLYLCENCVELAEEDAGYEYAPKEDCTELEEFEVEALEDWEDYFVLGWYTDARHKEIVEVELPRLLELQEIRLEEERVQREIEALEEAGQTNLFTLIGESA